MIIGEILLDFRMKLSKRRLVYLKDEEKFIQNNFEY